MADNCVLKSGMIVMSTRLRNVVIIGCAFKRFALSQVGILVLCEDAGLVAPDYALQEATVNL